MQKTTTVPFPDLKKTDYCCEPWDDIRVPAHIQMEGYDVPQYANVQYPWEGREEVELGQIPEIQSGCFLCEIF